MPTFASLFTGGGLADIGAMQAGYELLWGVEYDADIAAVANANLPHREKVYAESVMCIDWAKMTRPDHLHMSPPCQDFSVAKTSGKVGNDNDGLSDACVEALKALQPSTVTLENVEGYRKAPGFQRIVDHLWGAGYWVNVDVLNSADFGVPQTRRRMILRAVQGGFPGPLPEPVKPWRGWYEAIEDLIPELPETQFAPWQLERLPKIFSGESWMVQRQPGARGDGVRGVNEPAKTYCSTDTDPKALLLSKDKGDYSDGHRWQDNPAMSVTANDEGRRRAVLVDGVTNEGDRVTALGGDIPSFTVKASASKQASRASTPAGRVVRMTPRCLARFQSVPDWYALPEKKALACKIIGNGVPCLMMQRVMESFNS